MEFRNPACWEFEGPVNYMKVLARKREIPREATPALEVPARSTTGDGLSKDVLSNPSPGSSTTIIDQPGNVLPSTGAMPSGASPEPSRLQTSFGNSALTPQVAPLLPPGQAPPKMNPPLPPGLPPRKNPPLPPGTAPPLPPGPPPLKQAVTDFRKAAPIPESIKAAPPPPASVSAFRNPPPLPPVQRPPISFPMPVPSTSFGQQPTAGNAQPTENRDRQKQSRRPRGMSLSSTFRRTFESYEKVCQVGGGTYGDVFKARDRDTGDIVALKKIRLEDETEGFPVTALREIRFLSQANFDNIVRLKEVVTSKASDTTRNKGSVFMVFEYAECDLVGLMKSRKLSEPHIMCLLKQLLQAVHFAHVNHVLHRDIKPSNVLVNSQGILKLADWGLCRKWTEGNKYTNRVVTLWYRAPELLLGETQYTSAIDMWAVGCLMAELLIGRALFPGKDETNMLKLIFELCGKPLKEELPAGWANLAPDFFGGEATPSQMNMRFAFLRPQAKDLLFRLLELDPAKRISAKDALSHDYFWGKDPAPCDPSFLPIPKGDGLHEYQVREEAARSHVHNHPHASGNNDKRWRHSPVKH